MRRKYYKIINNSITILVKVIVNIENKNELS